MQVLRCELCRNISCFVSTQEAGEVWLLAQVAFISTRTAVWFLARVALVTVGILLGFRLRRLLARVAYSLHFVRLVSRATSSGVKTSKQAVNES